MKQVIEGLAKVALRINNPKHPLGDGLAAELKSLQDQYWNTKPADSVATEPRKHAHYFKPVPAGVTHVDVYTVLKMFDVTDQALGHAAKKLLVAGGRGAGKDIGRDVQEAIDTLARWQEIQRENYQGPVPLGAVQKVDWEARALGAEATAIRAQANQRAALYRLFDVLSVPGEPAFKEARKFLNQFAPHLYAELIYNEAAAKPKQDVPQTSNPATGSTGEPLKKVIRAEDIHVQVVSTALSGFGFGKRFVRVSHGPTGIIVESRNERSDYANRAKAMATLRNNLTAQGWVRLPDFKEGKD